MENIREPEKIIACAREAGFNALMTGAAPEELEPFARLARKAGIDTYATIAATATSPELAQVMSPEEEEVLRNLAADKEPRKRAYQWGGEPAAVREGKPETTEVLRSRVLCFHRPEACELLRKRIRDTLESCPSVAGVAFDFFGYQNYRSCECPVSQGQFEAWRRSHPNLSPDKAKVQFSQETLVAFSNDISAYVRSLRPNIKLATHVYPVFLPDPLYGNRLDVDYCCQTVAWFFEPYWPEEKVARYTRIVVGDGAKHQPKARGIPFIGLYVRKPFADKPVEQFAAELNYVFAAASDTSLSVCAFNALVDYPQYRDAFLRAAARQAR